MATTYTMLGTTVYGVPSGNYDGSSQDWVSDAVRAADYYRGYGGLQTITFTVTGFIGIIHLEATLDPNPGPAAWINTYSIGDTSTILTDRHPASIVGNFTWMRLRVELFDAGTINSVSITY
jgi:hypothetical protein